MLSFVRGPGGFWRRFCSEAVPVWAAALVGGVAIAFLPWGLALAAFLLAWVAVSAFLRWIRTKPRLRRLYRIALALHVLCWSALGVMHSRLQPAAPPGAPRVHDWGRLREVRVGVAASPFALPAHATLAGWGQRPRRMRVPPFGGFGVIGRLGQDLMGMPGEAGPAWPLFREADNGAEADLGARALVIAPLEATEEAAPVALVSVDLVTVERALAREVAARLAPLGVRPETLVVGATHTHSGPGGTSRQPLSEMLGTDHFDPGVFDAVVAACVEAVEEALAKSRPGRLRHARRRDRDPETGAPLLARNRRHEDQDRIDEAVHLLAALPREAGAGRPGLLLNYAVHPVLLRRRTTRFDADLAGDLREAFAAAQGAPEVVFLNGAAANISPRHGSAPPAERGPELARRFRDALLAQGGWRGGGAARVRIRAARVTRDLGTPHVVGGVGERAALVQAAQEGAFGGGLGTFVADAIALPLNAVIWASGVTEVRLAFHFSGAAGAIANLELSVPERRLDFGALRLELEGAEALPVLWMPAEATRALGHRLRSEVADGLLIGYANGVMGYVTTGAEYRNASYEARASVFGPRAAANVEGALRSAWEAVSR